MTISSRIDRAFRDLGLGAFVGGQKILAAYGQAHRHYHHAGHVATCLALADELAPGDAALTLALCYHDVVYDARSTTNEQQSADWATRDLTEAGAPAELISQVSRLILATEHRTTPATDDEKIMVDIDLSILGAPRPDYQRYADAIRQEYDWVSEEDFRRGRSAFLHRMLQRPHLFDHPLLRSRLETAARENLAWELARLGLGPSPT